MSVVPAVERGVLPGDAPPAAPVSARATDPQPRRAERAPTVCPAHVTPRTPEDQARRIEADIAAPADARAVRTEVLLPAEL